LCPQEYFTAGGEDVVIKGVREAGLRKTIRKAYMRGIRVLQGEEK
jgi:hypothetical protein